MDYFDAIKALISRASDTGDIAEDHGITVEVNGGIVFYSDSEGTEITASQAIEIVCESLGANP